MTKRVFGLAKLRKIIGYSQARLATKTGTTKATVENIELGRAPLNEQLAVAIAALTGVLPSSLGRGCEPQAFDGSGNYTIQLGVAGKHSHSTRPNSSS